MPDDEYGFARTKGGMPRFVVISGCSGGGKSTLLSELARRGYAVFDEPGRQVVKAELATDGDGLPWKNIGRFIELCLTIGVVQWEEARDRGGVSFFDRSIVDATSNLTCLKLPVPAAFRDASTRYPYDTRMFMAPPWPEIFANDDERRHTFADAVAEFEMLVEAYGRLGYEIVMLPKVSVDARAAFLLAQLNLPPGA